MRKIIVLSMITLDGVMQAPGGPGRYIRRFQIWRLGCTLF